MSFAEKIKKSVAMIGEKLKEDVDVVKKKLEGLKGKPLSTMTDDEVTLASMAEAAYKVVRPKRIGQYSYLKGSSDKKTAVYLGDNGEAIIAIRGTDFGNKEDVQNDTVIASGSDLKQTKRYRRTLELYSKLKKERSPKKIRFTGHSLGGSLAIELGNTTKEPSVVFNPGSSPLKKQSGHRVSVLKVVGDPVSFSPTPGSTKKFKGLDGVHPHLMKNFTQRKPEIVKAVGTEEKAKAVSGEVAKAKPKKPEKELSAIAQLAKKKREEREKFLQSEEGKKKAAESKAREEKRANQ